MCLAQVLADFVGTTKAAKLEQTDPGTYTSIRFV